MGNDIHIILSSIDKFNDMLCIYNILQLSQLLGKYNTWKYTKNHFNTT